MYDISTIIALESMEFMVHREQFPSLSVLSSSKKNTPKTKDNLTGESNFAKWFSLVNGLIYIYSIWCNHWHLPTPTPKYRHTHPLTWYMEWFNSTMTFFVMTVFILFFLWYVASWVKQYCAKFCTSAYQFIAMDIQLFIIEWKWLGLASTSVKWLFVTTWEMTYNCSCDGH